MHATYITSVIFPCYGSPRNTLGCTQKLHSLERNYLLGLKILACSVHSCTFGVIPMGQILQLSSCCTVNQENVGLHQCFRGPFLSEKKPPFSVCCYCQLMLVHLQMTTYTSEDATSYSKRQRHFRNKLVEAQGGKCC
jgi:hypothetical protein